MKRRVCIIILFLAAAGYSMAEAGSAVHLEAGPQVILPAGSSTDLFSIGTGGFVGGSLTPVFSRFISVEAYGRFGYLPGRTGNAIITAAAMAGPSVSWPLGERLTVSAGGMAGYYHWFPSGWDAGGMNGGGFAFTAGAGGAYGFTDRLSMEFSVGYGYYLQLMNQLEVSLFLKINLPDADGKAPVEKLKGKGVDITDLHLGPVFPVMYSYYDSHPIGRVTLGNFERKPVENLRVSFYVERYMDNPMEVKIPGGIEPGTTAEIDVYGLFTEDLLQVTEGTKASARLTLAYTLGGKDYTRDYNPVIEFYNRNAMTWEDDRRIASFVTTRDPVVLAFSKNVMNWTDGSMNAAVDKAFQKGMALFEALRLYGIAYQIDPVTPFSRLSEDETAVDFLQFPRQTMQYSSGDCDDLSVLYTAMLEAVGVETAVITIPGHIYTAFALEMPADEAMEAFSRRESLIFIENKAWIPVEITMIGESFDKAWLTGAREWRENSSEDMAGFYPLRDAWTLYQPVGFSEGAPSITLPNRDGVTEAFSAGLKRHIETEIHPRVTELREKIDRTDDNLRFKNQLAVVYARYGLYEEALTNFQEIAAEQDYTPVLTNLGNIHYILGDYNEAGKYYLQALEKNPRNTIALLGMARSSRELEDYGRSGEAYARLKELDPDLAGRFAYLDLRGEEATRASSAADGRTTIVWEVEE